MGDILVNSYFSMLMIQVLLIVIQYLLMLFKYQLVFLLILSIIYLFVGLNSTIAMWYGYEQFDNRNANNLA
jgi:hypothetical protein